MNVFKQELKFQGRSIFYWTGSVTIVLMIFMSLFPSFSKEAGPLKQAMAAFPSAMLTTIGIDIDTIFEAGGFVSYIYGFIELCLAIMGALYGYTVMGREKMARMNDFLYAKPAARRSVFIQKLLVALLLFTILNGALFVIFGWLAYAWTIDANNLALINQIILGGFLLQLFMFALATLLSLISRRIKNPIGSATGLGFGFFLVLMIGRLMDETWIKRLTPFGYVEPLMIIQDGLALTTIVGFLLITLLLLALSLYLWQTTDLEA